MRLTLRCWPATLSRLFSKESHFRSSRLKFSRKNKVDSSRLTSAPEVVGIHWRRLDIEPGFSPAWAMLHRCYLTHCIRRLRLRLPCLLAAATGAAALAADGPRPLESDDLNKKKLDEREKNKVKARVITRLLYRHWDSWVDDKRQHLFVVPVKNGAAAGDPRDLTPGDRDAVPTSTTFSVGDDFAFSPDGRKLAYTATPVPVREEAWLTNHDVYEVDLKTGERRQVTTNPAADGFPRYSPDGKWIAYRAQTRPGFEADRWQLMLCDRVAGQPRSLTADFDSPVEAFIWAPDRKTIYFEAEE